MDRNWITYQNDEKEIRKLMTKYHLTEIQSNILLNRGIFSKEKIELFLHGTLDDLHNPLLINDMDKGTDIIINAINNKKKIVIYGDYDSDGITSTATAIKGLTGLDNSIEYYLPDRIEEGYGMNINAIKKLKSRGCDLIVTVDNGITDKEEIDFCNELGIDVVLTDHHNIPTELPNAKAIINPKLGAYPFDGLAGCGVIFKVMQVIYRKLGREKDVFSLLDLVAIGTVADVVTLTDENRILVKEGLKVLNQTKNIGLQALLKELKLEGKKIESDTIGFGIGPVLNATGRLYNAYPSLELLLENDFDKAQEIAKELINRNQERKNVEKDWVEYAEKYVKKHNLLKNKVIVIYGDDIPEGIIGLIAGKIKEKYYRPTFCFTKAKNTHYKASARSIETFNLFSAMQECKDSYLSGGGHALAAGLSVEGTKEALEIFSKAINEVADRRLSEDDLIPTTFIDVECNNVSEKIIDELEILKPFGQGNKAPKFLMEKYNITDKKYVGDGTHISFSGKAKGIAFGLSEKYKELKEPDSIDIIFYPQMNEYSYANKNGSVFNKTEFQLQIIDIRKAKIDEKVTPKIALANLIEALDSNCTPF